MCSPSDMRVSANMSSGYSGTDCLSFLRRSAVAMSANPVVGRSQPEAKVPDRLAGSGCGGRSQLCYEARDRSTSRTAAPFAARGFAWLLPVAGDDLAAVGRAGGEPRRLNAARGHRARAAVAQRHEYAAARRLSGTADAVVDSDAELREQIRGIVRLTYDFVGTEEVIVAVNSVAEVEALG